MRGVVLHAPRDVRVEEREDPRILLPTDAIIRLSATCVCGSDLWPYRGIETVHGPSPMGHEYVGVVQEVGGEVRRSSPASSSSAPSSPPTTPAPSAARATSPRASIGSRWAGWVPRRSTCGYRWPTAPWSPRPTSSRRPGPGPARGLRRARHRLVRRGGRRGGPGQDRRGRRRRCGGSARRAGGPAARRGTRHRGQPARAPPEAGDPLRRHRHRHRARRRRRGPDQGPDRRPRRALGHRGGRHPGVDVAGHPLHPGGRSRRLRRRGPRRRTARRGAVLLPRAPARRPRPGASLPARADRPDLQA